MTHSRTWAAIGLALGLSLVGACSDDDGEETSAPDATTAAATTATGGATGGTGATGGAGTALDANGDGDVVFGIATPGPRDDGAYYQALVDGVTAFSETNGYSEPIVVDNIPPAEAATSIENLARQGVDVVMVGAGEISDSLNQLIPQYPDILWYCNCGAGYEDTTGQLIQSNDDSSEISYTAGYATGLLMRDAGQTQAAFLGSSNFDFEQEAFRAFELGLQAVDPSFTVTYVATGSFNDVAAATEAFNNVYAQGARAVYPFLGGAHEAVVGLANDAGDVIVMSAGSADACDRSDLTYDIAVRFDAGQYVDTILAELQAGELTPGSVRTFKVGVDPQPGAQICDPTPEQQTALEDVYGEIASGAFADQFLTLKKEVYGF